MAYFDEPLNDYDTYFRDEHARNTSQFFEQLVERSGVDAQENIAIVSELRVIEGRLAESGSSRKTWVFLRLFLFALVAGLITYAIAKKGTNYFLIAPAVIVLVVIFIKVNPLISKLNERLAELEMQRKSKADEAWAQMDPLNALFTWSMARGLFQKTFPEVSLDEYLNTSRLRDLEENYGLSPSFNDGKSILISQSGALKGNPFAVVRYLEHWIGSRNYTGTLFITWTEQIRNEQGNYVTVNRSQTLTASVIKPFPEFQDRSALIYGHESAPNLSFSRMPSNLSGIDEGVLNNWRKGHAVKKAFKHARREVKSGSGQFTVMSNEEFEMLFNASDRDNEVEFRLLFTPLAQQEMVKLLNDKSIGYGDNFAFVKQGMVNLVEPTHLRDVQFDCDPRLFMSLELAQSRQFFNDFQSRYFKSVYFALAPALTIPLYREERSPSHMSNLNHSKLSSYWEHEAMANYIGEDNFRHQDSITRNLLKTHSSDAEGNTSRVTVTAYGYSGIERVDWIPVAGGDGRIHEVPVNWIEYIPVERQSDIVINHIPAHESVDENDGPNLDFAEHGAASVAENAIVRGSLAAVLLGY